MPERADVRPKQLQALLADVAPAGIRDTVFAIYFTLAFGVSSLWTALYSAIIDRVGPAAGLPIVFWLMASSFVASAVVMFPSGTQNGRLPEPLRRHSRRPTVHSQVAARSPDRPFVIIRMPY